ncbi:MAG TPA: hypothetical protein PKD64_01385 [Pirellulaceae bacterium]|nr:hypothetical protein [Pirellulaceae bacterium]HMO90823.1 hypothetical protein [Pirellulaceae bacterium]HMP68074.1 hypothetical protein [Pirellulaceae bacterium]
MNPQKLLILLLRFNALILCLAIPTAFLSVSTMAKTHEFIGLGEFPHAPITEYLARSCSLLYGLHGFVLLLISLKPERYWDLIGPIMLAHVALGTGLLVVDLSAGMPWYWTAAEGGPIMAFAFLILLLWHRCPRPKLEVSST